MHHRECKHTLKRPIGITSTNRAAQPELLHQNQLHSSTSPGRKEEEIMCNEEFYLEYLEQRRHAPNELIAARKAFHNALEDYIEALQECEFFSTIDFLQNRSRAEETKKGER